MDLLYYSCLSQGKPEVLHITDCFVRLSDLNPSQPYKSTILNPNMVVLKTKMLLELQIRTQLLLVQTINYIHIIVSSHSHC